MALFRSSTDPVPAPGVASASLTRHSSGLAEVSRYCAANPALSILDLGPTSSLNIHYFAERGHRIYSEDLLRAAADPALRLPSQPAVDGKHFLAENLAYSGVTFNLVLCWNLADYMEECLVKPAVARLWSLMKPGGMLLAFFHTQEAGPNMPCPRFHIASDDTLQVQALHAGSASLPLQRVFQNRHIENLFRDFASIRFFIARDHIREVLAIR